MRLIWESFRARLAIGAAIWIVVGLSVSGLILSELFRAHVTAQFDEELRGHAEELAALAQVDGDGRPYVRMRLSDPRFLPAGSGFYWQLADAAHPPVRSPSLANRDLGMTRAPPPPGVEQHEFLQSPVGLMRVVKTSVTPAGATAPLTAAVAVEERVLEEVLHHFNRTLYLSLGFIALGLISAALLQIWFGLRPLGRVQSALGAVRAGKLTRLPDDLPSEVRPLAADLNALLEANAEMLRRARAQAGNLGHTLKTPLAVLADEAERLRRSGENAAGELIAAQCERMQRQIDYQIARARAAALRSAPGVAADLAETVAPVLSAMQRLHGRRGVTFTANAGPAFNIALDAQDLAEILANLLDNGGKWARREVRLEAERGSGGRILVTVDDDGPGLPPEAWDVVFSVGRRLDEQKPGSGLGLAIVRDLVELYGGRIWLDQSPLGGLRARLELPAVGARA